MIPILSGLTTAGGGFLMITTNSSTIGLGSRCETLRSLHRPGTPLVLPNAWDAATARAVVAAGFPVVATTSGGIAASLGYEDHEQAPPEEMLAAAARVGRSVDEPVTVDAEAGYGMAPTELVGALQRAGAAGCNLEDTDHAAERLRDPARQAAFLRTVREAASAAGYGLVINARVDVFLAAILAGSDRGAHSQLELVTEGLRRARAYLEAGADCVFPIALWQRDALAAFMAEAPGPVNIVAHPQAPSLAELAELGVARVSYASFLHREAMEQFSRSLEPLAAATGRLRTGQS
jgi:2-methylisocitrate lyase-like PEP mutase family enzyme